MRFNQIDLSTLLVRWCLGALVSFAAPCFCVGADIQSVSQVQVAAGSRPIIVVVGDDIAFSHAENAEEFSQSRVAQIAQDDRGFMWFGTQYGLVRFDGYGHTVFVPDARAPNRLSGVFVHAIRKDSSGRLWVGWVDRHPPTTGDAPLLEHWQTYTMPVDKLSKRRGDFLFFPLEFLICSRELTDAFSGCIGGDVQLLPVRVEEDPREFCFWNIVNFVDVLNEAQTKYRYPPPTKSVPVDWVFHADRFDRSMLFRDRYCPMIPLVVTGVGAPEQDFYVRYHEMKLKGLEFQILWEGG